MLHIKLVKSLYGHNPRNRATVAALGLRKISQTAYHDDTPTIRGMIRSVQFLLEVKEGPKPEAKKAPARKPAAKAEPKEVKATAAAKPEKPPVETAEKPKSAPAKAAAKPKVASVEPAAKPKAAPKTVKETKK